MYLAVVLWGFMEHRCLVISVRNENFTYARRQYCSLYHVGVIRGPLKIYLVIIIRYQGSL
jgi:hypothetical protein